MSSGVHRRTHFATIQSLRRDKPAGVATVSTSIWGVATAIGSVDPEFKCSSIKRGIHETCPSTSAKGRMSLNSSHNQTVPLLDLMSYTQSFYKMLLWGPLETWKPVCVWKKPSHTLINNLNGSHTFSELKHGSWNCTANSLDCIKSPLRVCVSYNSFHLDGAFASRMNWLEQPVGMSFCELDRDRSGSKAKDVANGSLPQVPGLTSPETRCEFHEVLQLIPSVLSGPIVKTEHKWNVLRLKGSAWGRRKEMTQLCFIKK